MLVVPVVQIVLNGIFGNSFNGLTTATPFQIIIIISPNSIVGVSFFFTTVCIAVYELLLCHCFFSFQCPLISGSYPSLSIYFLFLFVKCEKFVVDFIFVLEIVRNFLIAHFFAIFVKLFCISFVNAIFIMSQQLTTQIVLHFFAFSSFLPLL